MPKVSGSSHALAGLVSLFLAALLVDYLRPYFPSVFAFLEEYATALSAWLETHFRLNIPSQIFIPVFVAIFLAFIWGVVYHRVRHRA